MKPCGCVTAPLAYFVLGWNNPSNSTPSAFISSFSSREMFMHDKVSFNDNGTVSAVPRHPLVWVPELSEGRREDDLLILPNIALLVS
jgi:hypothetical protein